MGDARDLNFSEHWPNRFDSSLSLPILQNREDGMDAHHDRDSCSPSEGQSLWIRRGEVAALLPRKNCHFPFRSPQSAEYTCLCSIVGSHETSILYMGDCMLRRTTIVVYICQS